MSGNRNQDHHAEQELAKYLDKYVYPEVIFCYQKNNIGKSVVGERIINKEDQMQGIDYRIKIMNSKSCVIENIDEKAQIYYMNDPLPTFAFEINSLQKGFVYPGWLFNDSLKTNVYMIIYPKSNSSLDKIIYSDFYSVECYLTTRNALLEYLNQRGFSE